ncbi:MAG: acyl carrier protein [Candidatus Eiseniibacteriota bacterium]
MSDVKDTVRRFIVETFLFGENGHLQDDTSFLDAGIIDSTGVLELVSFLEATYGISVRDEELIPENLDSLANIEAYLARKK